MTGWLGEKDIPCIPEQGNVQKQETGITSSYDSLSVANTKNLFHLTQSVFIDVHPG